VNNAEQLVREIQQRMAGGDPARDLKEQLWTSCLEVVTALANRYTRKRPQAREDFLGDAYIKFEHVLARYDSSLGVPFRAYLAGCVERQFHDRVRKRRDSAMEYPETLIDAREGALEWLCSGELATRVGQVLDELLPEDPRRQRKIMAFKLRHLEGWPVEEIRAWMKVSRPNTVSQWIHRVRKAFAREFPRRYPEYFTDLTAAGMTDE